MPSLSEIVGQEGAIEALRRAIAAGKLAQAYLFVGIEGVGKATTARALAAALSCQERPGEGCATCPSCRKLAEGTHPDLMRLEPEGANIKIAEVRALEEHLVFPPHEGRYRVVLVDGADRFTDSAANALLKSVEEPRPRNLFVLATSAVHRVVPTLVSRCQRIRFRPLATEDVLAILARQESPEPARLAAAALSGGSAGRALKLLASEQMGAIEQIVSSLLAAAGDRSVLPIFEAAGAAGRDRQLLGEALDYLRVWLRDLLLTRESLAGEAGRRLINAGRLEQLRAEATGWSAASLLAALRAVDEAQRALRGNVHATLALEHLGLRLRTASRWNERSSEPAP